ncbi:MAG: hypothetical protein WC796_05125 [Candidatus Pacearchaeota archaeon]|jgi:hypothetical protein
MESQRQPLVIIGFHDDGTRKVMTSTAAFLYVTFIAVDEYEEMLIAIEKAPDAAGYILDVNLQNKAGKINSSHGVEIYQRVRPRVESGKARFLAISGHPEPLEQAKVLGIPEEFLKQKPYNGLIGWFESLRTLNA